MSQFPNHLQQCKERPLLLLFFLLNFCPINYINSQARSYWQNPVVEISETPSRSVETQTVKKASCFRQFLRCVAADEKFKRQRQQSASGGKLTNSVSKIDQVSRILFPVSFFILNIFYWVRYAYFHDRCERMGG